MQSYRIGGDQMGFFGGDNDAHSESDRLLNEQIENDKAELEAKKQNLYQTKLDIIKGQGGQEWTPNRNPDQQRRNRQMPKLGIGGQI